MKESGKIAVYIGTFIIVMIGYIISIFVADFMIDLVSGIVIYPRKWNLGIFAAIEYLTHDRLSWLVYAIGWFVVCISVHNRSAKWFEIEEKAGLLSLFFLILWFISTSAIITGFILKILLGSTISLEGLIDIIFVALFWALAPSMAVLLGANNKSNSKE